MSIARRKAVGGHIFAGGFTGGVSQVFDVECQLEVHDLGHETTEKVWGVPVIHAPVDEWPRRDADLFYANPRCTGFSCITAGLSSTGHGPYSRQCQDVHDVMNYALGQFPVVIWESVQQAYTVGKPLLDIVRDYAISKGYRVAYLFVNAATFGNAQDRKRLFCCYYPREKQFNASLPQISSYYPVLWDAIGHLEGRSTSTFAYASDQYDRDSRLALTADEETMLSSLPTGWNQNTLMQYAWHTCPRSWQEKWDSRNSDMPASMHCMNRACWLRPCPTLTSSAGRIVHPWEHRPLTVGELSAVMGWGDKIPRGRNPIGQLAKGVVPAVGKWLAEQALACLDDVWNGEEWTSRYDEQSGKFEGEDSRGMDEKVIDLTRFVGKQFDVERYPEAALRCHNYNVCPRTGKLLRPWKDLPGKRA